MYQPGPPPQHLQHPHAYNQPQQPRQAHQRWHPSARPPLQQRVRSKVNNYNNNNSNGNNTNTNSKNHNTKSVDDTSNASPNTSPAHSNNNSSSTPNNNNNNINNNVNNTNTINHSGAPVRAYTQYSQRQAPPNSPYPGICLFVYHLPSAVNETTLYNLFSQYGPVLSAKVIKNLKTGESKVCVCVCVMCMCVCVCVLCVYMCVIYISICIYICVCVCVVF